MNDAPDHELLRCHADGGPDEAFTELVRRHCDLVWAAARRVSGDGEIARDVAQKVFTDLVRKAGKLPPGTVLAGWLYRAACLEAAGQIRCAARRTKREQHAMRQHELHAADAAEALAVAELQPVLDAALADLSEADRDAVVLRFLAGRSLAEVGATLGTNEDAAQKRVGRALEKLREAFRQRGVAVSGGLVAAALGVAGTQAAPVGLAAAIASAALATVGAATFGTFSAIALMKSKLAVGIVGTAVVATVLAWQQHNVNRLADENAALRQQVAAPPPSSVASPAVTSTADQRELARARDEHAELLRLRGEVSRIHQSGPAVATDLSRRLQSAEAHAAQAEAEAAMVKAMQDARQHSTPIVNALKDLGLAARLFATDHQDRFPATFDEMRNEQGVPADGIFPGGISLDLFEFFPHERVISQAEYQLILFREKVARQLPDGAWERVYGFADGAVRAHRAADGDFSQIEREGTGTAANARKRP